MAIVLYMFYPLGKNLLKKTTTMNDQMTVSCRIGTGLNSSFQRISGGGKALCPSEGAQGPSGRGGTSLALLSQASKFQKHLSAYRIYRREGPATRQKSLSLTEREKE